LNRRRGRMKKSIKRYNRKNALATENIAKAFLN